jgi:hypothetical protein
VPDDLLDDIGLLELVDQHFESHEHGICCHISCFENENTIPLQQLSRETDFVSYIRYRKVMKNGGLVNLGRSVSGCQAQIS